MQSNYTTTQKQNVIDLINQGNLTVKQIAEMTGTNKKYVYNITHRYVKTGKPIRLHVGKSSSASIETQSKKRGRRPLPFDEAAVLALYKAGYNRQKIVEMLHVSDVRARDAIKQYRADHPGYTTPKETARLERDKQICELRKAGKTYAEIAEIVGMSYSGVFSVCSKCGLTTPAKRARRDNGAIPEEVLAPLLDYMRKFISAEFAAKVQALAKQIA